MSRSATRFVAVVAVAGSLLFGWAPPTAALPGAPDQVQPQGCPGGPAGPAAPGTVCPDGSMPVDPPPEPVCDSAVAAPPTGDTCPGSTAERDAAADRQLRNILGLDEAGVEHPLEAYDIGCDEGAWNAFLRKLWCAAQAMPFALGKWAVGLGINLLAWALEFRIADSLALVSGLLSRIYDASLLGPLGVRHLAWTLTMFVVGWHLARARLAKGVSELATTFLIATVGSIILANPQGYLEGSIALAKNASGAVLEAVDDTLQPSGSGNGSEDVRERLADIFHRSFVAEPYDIINWGEPLDGECAAARDAILTGGPWGSDDRPRDIMRDHGCDEQADFNERPTDSRAAGSLIVSVAALGATALLVANALVVFVAQLTLVALFAGASIIWTAALFPGARGLLWWWLERLVWAVAITTGATFVLSWLAITTTAALAATTDLSIIQRCLLVLLIVAFGYRLRSQVGRAVDTMSRHVGDGMTRVTRQPGRASTLATAGTAAAGGFGLAATTRSWAMDIPGGQYTYSRLYARHFTRGYRGGRLRGTRRGLRRAQEIDLRLTEAGTNAARAVGRSARTAAMAPVLAPAAYASTRRRVTNATTRARERLASARATSRTWRRNVRHPVQAVRVAQGQPARPTATVRPNPVIPPKAPSAESAAARYRARMQETRLDRQQRARDAGHPLRALLDAQRESRDQMPTSPPPRDPDGTTP